MAQWEKAFTAKPDDLCSVPRMPILEENGLPQVALQLLLCML